MVWENFLRSLETHKDTFCRFINHERFNWRTFVYLLAAKITALCDDEPLRQKVFIADVALSIKPAETWKF